MNVKLPLGIEIAMKLMESEGLTPYLVGGCVRDTLMNKPPKDYDITVNAMPDNIIELFCSNGYNASLKGREFGTVVVNINNEEIEITPHRTEGNYRDSRHPDTVKFVKDINLDLSRRDFTVNAIAMDLGGNILDNYNGVEDIKNEILNCVGDPQIRFSEDVLRIMRAIRFASRFGFKIEKHTRKAMSDKKHLLSQLSSERILAELRETIIFPGSYEVIKDCFDIIEYIIPGFIPHNILSTSYGDFSLRFFSCIAHNDFAYVQKICTNLKLSNTEANKIYDMHLLYHKVLTQKDNKIFFDNKTKEALCNYPSDYITDLFVYSKSNMYEYNDYLNTGVYTIKKLAVNGTDIIATGLFPKELTSKLLKYILKKTAIGRVKNTKKDILEFLNSIKAKDIE